MLDHSLLIPMTYWADSLRDLYWSNRFNDQFWNYDFYIAITIRNFSFCANVPISQGMGLHMLNPDRSSVETNGGLECWWAVYFGHKLCQSIWEDQGGLSIWGYKESAQAPPPPKNIIHKSNTQFFLLSFFAQVIIRQLKFESSRTSTKLNFCEIFKWMTEISILHAITQMYGDVWKLLLTSVEDKNALFRTKRTKNKSFPWIINKLLREIYKGDFLKRKATSSNDPLIGKQFKDEPNKTNNAIKKAKRKNFSEIPDANKGDPHKTWRFINKLQSSQK